MVRRALAIVIDSVALVGFVLIGLREHSETPGAVLILRNAVPILASWFPVALATGAYRTLDVGALLSTWIVAIPTAVLARSLWVGTPTGGRFAIFLLIALGFTLLFLLAGRLLARVLGIVPAGPRRA
jgi:hypothetical protein